MESILDYFIAQTYGSIEDAHEADRQADLNEDKEQQIAQHNWDKAMQHLADAKKPISTHLYIPTAIKEGELDQTTESHSNFSSYDHSLEQVRNKKAGLTIMKIDVDYGKDLIPITQEVCEKTDTSSVPDLTGIFDSNFMWPE